jgi:dihydroorotate dehydrogenase electron transfer subunit
VVEVLEVVQETPTVRTLTFRDEPSLQAAPGQFLMVWVPGVDEIPMSLAPSPREGEAAVTVKPVGEGSWGLYNTPVGGLIGVRGPYGKGFTPEGRRILLAGGGTGMAPLALILKAWADRFSRVGVVIGARSGREILFEAKIRSLLEGVDHELRVCTDDGSRGLYGVVPEVVKAWLEEEWFDTIYTCGPEVMCRKVVEEALNRGLRVQASLERIMKCGIGICGSCALGRYVICWDGPVLGTEELREVLGELGVWRLDASGRRIRPE